MNLSRRSLLTGLLSSAAVIAAGPVAKVMPMWSVPTRWDGHNLTYLEGLSQRLSHTFLYGNPDWLPVQFTGFIPRYDTSIDGALALVPHQWPQDVRSNVLDCGEPPCTSWGTFAEEQPPLRGSQSWYGRA